MPCQTDPGFFCGPGASGDQKGTVCPTGSFCIGGSADKADCTAQPGAYCPQGSKAPSGVPCPVGWWCAGGSADKKPCHCSPGSVCSEGDVCSHCKHIRSRALENSFNFSRWKQVPSPTLASCVPLATGAKEGRRISHRAWRRRGRPARRAAIRTTAIHAGLASGALAPRRRRQFANALQESFAALARCPLTGGSATPASFV